LGSTRIFVAAIELVMRFLALREDARILTVKMKPVDV
jgi:hypothetical protein